MAEDSPSHISESEWNFKSCPENELRLCLHYELAREIDLWREMVAHRRNEIHPLDNFSYIFEHFPEGGSVIMPPMEFAITYPHLAPLVDWQDWPRLPWLELDESKRRECATKAKPSEAWALFTDAWPLMKGSNPDCFVTDKIGENLISYTALKIEWRKPDAQLLREFAAWLSLRREQVEGVAVETRGGKTYALTLKKLGAYRLLKNMSWEKASELTASILGSPIYSEHSAWSRAKSQLLALLAEYQKHGNLDSVI